MSHIKLVKLSVFVLLISHFEKLIKVDHNNGKGMLSRDFILLLPYFVFISLLFCIACSLSQSFLT